MGKIKQWQLKHRQSLPLDLKVERTKQRIREWYHYWGGDVYLSFSGGKDSTVLKHIIDDMDEYYSDIPLVFCDTGLQFPEVKRFVYSFINDEDDFEEKEQYGYTQRYYDNGDLVILKPKMPFKDVIEKYGYPVISKEQAQYIDEYRNTESDELKRLRWNGRGNGSYKISEKWKFLADAPFKISHKCCNVMKKRPFHRYEKETGRKPIIGVMAENSSNRKNSYLRNGCNSFDEGSGRSRPIAFWREQDVLKYIYDNNVEIADVYGEVVYDEGDGYKTTQRQGTGCVWCMFGVHLDDEPNRFQRLKETHPKLWGYCINELGLGEILDYIGVDYE